MHARVYADIGMSLKSMGARRGMRACGAVDECHLKLHMGLAALYIENHKLSCVSACISSDMKSIHAPNAYIDSF